MDYTNVRRVNTTDDINAALGRAYMIKTSESALDEMRRRYASTGPKPTLLETRLYGAPIHVDPDVPDGFAYAGGVLLDFRPTDG